MPLLRKHRRFRPGLPEFAGFLLLFGTIALGAEWVFDQTRAARMARTAGRIVEVSGGETSATRVYFTYTVNGLTYSNVVEPGFGGASLATLLPARIMAQLTARGIVSFDDLPEEARRQIREGTDHTFDELSEADREALQQHGYQNAEQLRLAMLSAMDGTALAPITNESTDNRMRIDAAVQVLYDPNDPARSMLAPTDAQPQRADLAGLTPFLIAVVLTCVYFGAAYPRLKGQRA